MPGVAADDDDAAAHALVIARARAPAARPRRGCRVTSVGHSAGGRRMADIDDDDVADFVAGEQMPTPEAAERDREIGARRPVHRAGEEVEPGRPVDRDDRQLERRAAGRAAPPRRAAARP